MFPKLWAPLTLALLFVVASPITHPLSLTLACLLHAEGPTEEALAVRVRKSIERGEQFLRTQQNKKDGHWEYSDEARREAGGMTSLALLALLNAGVEPDDPMIRRGLGYLRTIKPGRTYVVALQTMVFALTGNRSDMPLVQRNVDWLIKNRMFESGRFIGWGYPSTPRTGPDNSVTQYALLGLYEAQRAGAKIERGLWQEIREYYERTQRPDGGWSYINDRTGSSLTMTTAGLCGLLLADMEAKTGGETYLPSGTVKDCGNYNDERNRHIGRAIHWIGTRLPATADAMGNFNHSGMGGLGKNVFYSLYGIERAGRFSGERFFGGHDWYRIGCEFLVDSQQSDGSWKGTALDGHPVVATSFALLFLSKGRTPVLISKLAHGPGDSHDWNSDRNDARNLVEFASRELFKRRPLAWQIFDARRSRAPAKELAAELLQTPIVYITGHRAPRLLKHREMLKEYLDHGGFILAEACCDSKDFDEAFRGKEATLIEQLFGEDYRLKLLPDDHPIYTASGKFAVSAREYPLYGIEMGCKTVLIYSPKDLSCRWESNQHNTPFGRSAFQLGANIIAYATGMEIPQDRGTRVEIVRDEGGKKPPRGSLKVAQLKYGTHARDWQLAPRAMPNLMFEMRKLGVRVDLKTENVSPTAQDVVNFKFLYMHGRNAFSYNKDDLKHLQFNLKTGGLLFADAGCGSKQFDKSFRAMVRDLLGEDLQPIDLNDELFSKELNGTAITKVRCRREGVDGKTPDTEFREVAPRLEGVKINGRWAVIYSKYDIGCALEKHQSTACLGHDHESAVRLGKAVVLYSLVR